MKKSNFQQKTGLSRQRGFTIIEIGVAVLILSVGILGVAGMQSVGVRESQNTYFRSQANLLVMDMANRMWANKEQAHLGSTSQYVGPVAQVHISYRTGISHCCHKRRPG